MAINRFQRVVQPARFNPLSIQEMSLAPIALRKREDALLNQADVLLNQLNQIEVPDIYQDEVNQQRQALENDLNNLAERITTEGAGNLNVLGDFRNLRNRYNQAVSPNGDIGRAAAVDAEIKTMKDQYFNFAIEQGWGSNPGLVNQRWEEELQRFKQGLPTQLSGFSGQLPQMQPSFAPKNLDLSDEMIKLQKLVGKAQEAHSDFRFVPNTDPATGQVINYNIVNAQGQTITNDPNLAELKNYMENRLLDPNSDINSVLKFRGTSPEDYLNQVDDLINMMRVNSAQTGVKYAGQTPSNRSAGTSGRTRRSGSSNVGQKAQLLSTSSGQRELPNSRSTSEILAQIDVLNRNEDGLTDDELQRQLNAYNHALKQRRQQEGTPEYKNQMNQAIQDNSQLASLGINNLDQYNQFIADPGNRVPGPTMMIGDRTGARPIETPSDAQRAIQAFNTIPSPGNNFRIGSEYYSLGPYEADQKLAAEMGKGLHNVNLKDMAARGALSITNNKGNLEKVGVDQYDDFQLDIQNADKVEYFLDGLETGTLSDPGAMVYTVKSKSGDETTTYTMSIDLEQGSDLTAALLDRNNPLYQQLDLTGQLTLDQMRDNLQYGGVAVDSDLVGSFDLAGTNSILTYSQIKHMSEGAIPRTQEDPLRDYTFIQPGNEYSISMNNDNSYSLYKRQDNQVAPYRINDFMTQMSAENERRTSNTWDAGTIPEAKKQAYIEEFMTTLVNTTSNLDNPSEGANIYSDSAIYSKALQDYQNALFTNNPQVIRRAAINAFEQIKNLRVSSKNVKSLL